MKITVKTELYADINISLERNTNIDRLLKKPTKRDIKNSTKILMNLHENFKVNFEKNELLKIESLQHIKIQNDTHNLNEVAEEIMDIIMKVN